MAQIFCAESDAPVQWDITAFYNHTLIVFYSGFYYFAHDGPQKFRKRVVVFGRKVCAAASYQPHLQMVDRKIGDFIFFEKFLRECSLSGVCGAG